MRSLLRRIERLEKRIISEPILLGMPDGSTERTLGDPNYLLDIMMCALNGEEVPEMEIIAHSVSAVEPSGSHMTDVARLVYDASQKKIQLRDDHPGE